MAEPHVTVRAQFARAHCPRCKGTGKTTHTGREFLGGVEVRAFTYTTECAWCRGVENFLAAQRQNG